MLRKGLLLLIAVTGIQVSCAYFERAGEAQRDYLISVIDNPATTPEDKIAAQFKLATVYIDEKTDYDLRDVAKAKKICEELLENELVNYEVKTTIKLFLAHILSGVIKVPSYPWNSVSRNYSRAIKLYTEIINDQAAASDIKAKARYYLGSLFAGTYGDLPLEDLKQAKKLFSELIADGEVKEVAADLYASTQCELADLLIREACKAMGKLSKGTTLPKDITKDFDYAIQLYNTVMSNSILDDELRDRASWTLGILYLGGPEYLYSYEKGVGCLKKILENGRLEYKEQARVKGVIAYATAFKKDATRQNVLQAVELYNELLHMDFLSHEMKKELQVVLEEIQAIDLTTLPSEPLSAQECSIDMMPVSATSPSTAYYITAAALGAFLGLGCVYYCISNGVF